MDTQLQDIIEKIHNEGVKEAEERAKQIIESAGKQAKEQIEKARNEAEAIRKEADAEAQKLRASGEAALKQASRDLLLSVRKDLTALFESVQREAVGESLTPQRMGELIGNLVSNWIKDESSSLDILVNEKDRDALEHDLKKRLAGKLKEGYQVRPVRGISAGFRASTDSSGAYLDFTDEAISELLAAYLNPRLAEVMQNAGKE
ncbi:MAG: V-type ATP synthase subunit E [Alkalispirochaeta sp.]|jgi:V/A-type H+-transporting ATPase subunit E